MLMDVIIAAIITAVGAIVVAFINRPSNRNESEGGHSSQDYYRYKTTTETTKSKKDAPQSGFAKNIKEEASASKSDIQASSFDSIHILKYRRWLYTSIAYGCVLIAFMLLGAVSELVVYVFAFLSILTPFFVANNFFAQIPSTWAVVIITQFTFAGVCILYLLAVGIAIAALSTLVSVMLGAAVVFIKHEYY